MNHQQQDISGMHLWLVLWKAYRALETVDKRSIADLGIGGISDFAILEVLFHKGCSPINTIGKKVGLTSGSITAAVDRAEKKQWVRRVADPQDRRVVKIELTDQGRDIIETGLKKHAGVLENAAAVLEADERAQLIELLKKIGYHAQAISTV